MPEAGKALPSLALLAQDAFLRRSGIARYQAELVTRLAGRCNLHLLVVSPSHVIAANGGLPGPMAKAVLEQYTDPVEVLRNGGRIIGGLADHPEYFDWNPLVLLNVLSSRLFVGAAVDRARFDLVHGTASYLPLTRGPTARVITVHDTTPLTMPARHTRSTVKCFVRPREIRPTDQLIADSQSGLRDILAVVDHPSENSHVIPLGIDRAVFHPGASDQGGSGAPYILSVGTIEPRKNLPRALAAFERVATNREQLRWKIAGSRGWGWGEFARALERSPARGRVDLLGAVPDEALADLYRGALAVLFPTLWEGFGFPVVEALACGAPVAASKLPAIDEAGGDAYVPLDPENADSISEALERAAFDSAGRAARKAAGIEYVRRFDWDRAADLTLGAYAQALGRTTDELLYPAARA